MSAKSISPDMAFQLADTIGHAHALFSNDLESVARSVNMTVKELIALWIASLYEQDLTQSEWARLQGVSRQRGHVIARSLVRAELISIHKEGRSSTVRLLPGGKELVAMKQREMGEVLAEALSGFPEDDATQLQELLERLLQVLQNSN